MWGVFNYIECWYNTQRRHSALNYMTPNQYNNFLQTRKTAAKCLIYLSKLKLQVQTLELGIARSRGLIASDLYPIRFRMEVLC